MSQACEGPAQGLGDVGVRRREPLDVQLVDHRAGPVGRLRAGLEWARRARHGLGHNRTAVGLPGGVEHRAVQAEWPIDLLRERVEQQPVRIEPQAPLRIERPMGAQAVAGAGAHAIDEAMENPAGAALQRDAGELHLAGGVEQAEFDEGRVRRVHGHVQPALHGADAQGLGRLFASCDPDRLGSNHDQTRRAATSSR